MYFVSEGTPRLKVCRKILHENENQKIVGVVISDKIDFQGKLLKERDHWIMIRDQSNKTFDHYKYICT